MGVKKKDAFPKPLRGRFIGKGRWRLTRIFLYINPPVYVKVPRGFVTNGASIPKLAWSLIGSPWSGRYARGAVIHDFLYFSQMTTRYKADRIFYRAMQILGVPFLKRWVMYQSVRLVAWICWNERKKERRKKNHANHK